MSTTYHNPETGIKITVSKPAEKILEPRKVPRLVAALTEMMSLMGATYAYVSKRGCGLEISVHGPEGWTGTMEVKAKE